MTYFIRQFLTQDVTNPVSLPFFILCRIFLSTLTVCIISSFLTRSVQLIFSILLQQKFPGIFGLLSEISKLQHHTKLSSKGQHFSGFVLKFEVQFASEKSLLLAECCWLSSFNFSCTSCMICYLLTKESK